MQALGTARILLVAFGLRFAPFALSGCAGKSETGATNAGDDGGGCLRSCYVAPICSGACWSAPRLVAVACSQLQPIALAVDSTNVYWVNEGGSIVKAPLAGGPPITLASGQPNPQAIAIDSTNVYWVTNVTGVAQNAVLKMPLHGGAISTLATGLDPRGIAVDTTSVYWTDGTRGGGRVWKVPISGVPDGGSPTLIATAKRPAGPTSILVDSSSVYWTEVPTSGAGTVLKAPLDGGTAQTLASGQFPIAMAVDGTSLYWTNEWGGGGSVTKVPVSGGTPVTIATGILPSGIAVDSTGVYWGDTSAGTVNVIPLDGGASTPIVRPILSVGGTSNCGGPVAVAVDSTSVYWTFQNGYPSVAGQVMKMTPK